MGAILQILVVAFLADRAVPAAHRVPDHAREQPRNGGFAAGGIGFGIAGGGWAWYGAPFYMTVGPNGPLTFAPGGGFMVPVVVDGGPLGGPAPPGMGMVPRPAPVGRRPDAARSAQLQTIGDRLFRAGNLKRSSERYEQAVRADPDLASPRIRLAQVAIHRGNISEAARLIRAAVAAEPGWLPNAPDIQALYAEPADFARQIARLEARVQVEPGDRDAWLVLGAQLYLSRRPRRAADIFLRLSDRKGDPALAAFLDVSRPAEFNTR